jgi:hypothetical protein
LQTGWKSEASTASRLHLSSVKRRTHEFQRGGTTPAIKTVTGAPVAVTEKPSEAPSGGANVGAIAGGVVGVIVIAGAILGKPVLTLEFHNGAARVCACWSRLEKPSPPKQQGCPKFRARPVLSEIGQVSVPLVAQLIRHIKIAKVLKFARAP